MEPLPLVEKLSPSQIAAMDADAVSKYNVGASERFHLRAELAPSAYEGDIERAPIVLLLANPGFDETSTTSDHCFVREGWPLGGLHPEAPCGLRHWWEARLRLLIEAQGIQKVAQRVACLQITPWASTGFDASLRLPSRAIILDAASRCAERGAVLIVMRAEKLWLEATALVEYASRFRVRSWRSSYLTPGNLDAAAWRKVLEALSDV